MDAQGNEIVGHDSVVEQFRRIVQRGKMATTFLFVGPDGIGKRTFALRLAKSLLCTNVPAAELDPCGVCPDCQQVESDSHPDLRYVKKPVDRAFIPVETLIGDRDHRMREGLCHFMSLTPSGGKRRVAIIDDADWLNQEGANSLLKTLEEPAPGSLIILLATSEQRQLPTIRSRCQTIRFHGLSDSDVARCLLSQGAALQDTEAARMAALGDGSISRALAWAKPATREFCLSLWSELGIHPGSRERLVTLINEYLELAGKEMAEKRPQLREAVEAMMEFYRAVARLSYELPVPADADLVRCVSACRAQGHLSAELASVLIERCIDSLRHIGSNASLNVLVDALVCDLRAPLR